MAVLAKTLEEYFSHRNMSKLRLNDIDHNKKKLKKEYNEAVLLSLAENLNINDNGTAEEAEAPAGRYEEEKEADESQDKNEKEENGSVNGVEGRSRTNGSSEYDLAYLDKTIRMLRDDDDKCIDPGWKNLHEVKIIDVPAPNRHCPCGSKLRFKKCCQGRYELLRTDVMNQIDELLMKNGYNDKKQASTLLFV